MEDDSDNSNIIKRIKNVIIIFTFLINLLNRLELHLQST